LLECCSKTLHFGHFDNMGIASSTHNRFGNSFESYKITIRLLSTGFRCGVTAAPSFSQSTSSGRTATPYQHVRPPGFCCSWPDAPELSRTISGIQTLLQTRVYKIHSDYTDNFKRLLKTFCFQRTSAISALDVLRRCALQIYILLTYLLTLGLPDDVFGTVRPIICEDLVSAANILKTLLRTYTFD